MIKEQSHSAGRKGPEGTLGVREGSCRLLRAEVGRVKKEVYRSWLILEKTYGNGSPALSEGSIKKTMWIRMGHSWRKINV